MSKLYNFMFWVLFFILLFVCLNSELKYVKIDVDDCVKILLLVCLLVLHSKTNSEDFSNFKMLEGNDPDKKCGYDNINLFEDEFNPDELCNYVDERR